MTHDYNEYACYSEVHPDQANGGENEKTRIVTTTAREFFEDCCPFSGWHIAGDGNEREAIEPQNLLLLDREHRGRT